MDSNSIQYIDNTLSDFACQNGLYKISVHRAKAIADLGKKDGKILLAYSCRDSSEYYKLIFLTERKITDP